MPGRLTAEFELHCPCGKVHIRKDASEFTCACGRLSEIKWAAPYAVMEAGDEAKPPKE